MVQILPLDEDDPTGTWINLKTGSTNGVDLFNMVNPSDPSNFENIPKLTMTDLTKNAEVTFQFDGTYKIGMVLVTLFVDGGLTSA